MARQRYPGSIERRGDSFRVILYADGVRHGFTVRTKHRATAEEAARLRHAELQRLSTRQRHGLPSEIRMSSLLDKFGLERLPLLAPNTKRTYRISLTFAREFFVHRCGDLGVHDVRQGHIKDFIGWRRNQRRHGVGHLSNRTLQKDRATLHAVFAFAEELELREGNPVSRVRPPKSDPREPVILTSEEYRRLLDACEDRPMLRLYVLTMGETGARCESEILFLRWEDVKLDQGFLWIASGRDGHRTKSGKGRWVPMTPALLSAFREHFAQFRFSSYEGAVTRWVFHHTTSHRRARAGSRITSLRCGFRAATLRAGLPVELHQHDLRHRRVTTWLADGQNPVHVKEAVGHADLRTTMAYTHLSREHLRTLVDTRTSQAASQVAR
jgi:integrase